MSNCAFLAEVARLPVLIEAKTENVALGRRHDHSLLVGRQRDRRDRPVGRIDLSRVGGVELGDELEGEQVVELPAEEKVVLARAFEDFEVIEVGAPDVDGFNNLAVILFDELQFGA